LSDDPYPIPGTETLRNRPGITTPDQLSLAGGQLGAVPASVSDGFHEVRVETDEVLLVPGSCSRCTSSRPRDREVLHDLADFRRG